MNCQTKLRINHLTAVKSVAILESNANLNFYTWKKKYSVVTPVGAPVAWRPRIIDTAVATPQAKMLGFESDVMDLRNHKYVCWIDTRLSCRVWMLEEWNISSELSLLFAHKYQIRHQWLVFLKCEVDIRTSRLGHSWLGAGLVHPTLRSRLRPKSVDFHDAENR
ncbi:hypothetical protein TNCV_4236051 [Trichonephila clavipes]|nr:hypothetical protein TNCV_4236051 [Trichonephila clavipes]